MTRPFDDPLWSATALQLIRTAFHEDFGRGADVTSTLIAEPRRRATAKVVFRKPGIISGLSLAPFICLAAIEHVKADLVFQVACGGGGRELADGDPMAAGATAATISGPLAPILGLERTLLNFLARMSGVATLTRQFVDAARTVNPEVQILDTRKTLPGWRELDRYAVRCGGGTNHRAGLFDAVLLKDNHLAGIPVGQLEEALNRWLANVPEGAQFVEVEVDGLEQFEQVCGVPRVDVVLLDNFTPADTIAAVQRRNQLRRPRPLLLEASGGITLDSVGDYAATGVDRISVGAITHSAPALDISLDF